MMASPCCGTIWENLMQTHACVKVGDLHLKVRPAKLLGSHNPCWDRCSFSRELESLQNGLSCVQMSKNFFTHVGHGDISQVMFHERLWTFISV